MFRVLETKNINENKLEIDLIFYNKVINKGYMFAECYFLLELYYFNDIDKNCFSKVINIYEEPENLFDYFKINNQNSENNLNQDLDNLDLVSEELDEKSQQNSSNLSTLKNI